MKKISILLIATLVILSGCSLEAPGWAKKERQMDAKNITIGVSISTLNNPFFVSVKEGIETAAKAAGITVKIADAQNDSSKQSNDVDDLIQQDVDMLLVNPVDSAAISAAVKTANDADIPVIAIDRSADKGKVETLVASDNREGGKMAADFIIAQLGQQAKVAELEGTPGASATRERGEGFHSVADTKLAVVEKQSADFDRTKGLNVAENVLQANASITAIFAQNDEMALGAVEAAKAAGKDILIVGFDGNDDGLKAVKEGKMAATIAQQPELIGQKAVEAVTAIADGKTLAKTISVDLKLVTSKK
ncbi:D-ribose ABC transporter substrate-binding protein [Brochothrix campestris]|uniref:Ribose ABC transporter ribose-binding lipoprotein n=1 Tax=Brochothrix campestris FSL F6-1037 TaxID=1265861 RepID=W7D8B0_9LIST|nr:D-ribose ABC transporter substrate-binding protein [Brochothrix campestris]EUJ41673.1 ribose ABC transporter ribose-binding lipoprotein [Brochothrix campestris FSL F6-1037]